MSGTLTTDAQLRVEIAKLKKSVEALEAHISVLQGNQVTIGTSHYGLTIKKDGDVSIRAKNLDIVASNRATIKSSGPMVLKARKIVN